MILPSTPRPLPLLLPHLPPQSYPPRFSHANAFSVLAAASAQRLPSVDAQRFGAHAAPHSSYACRLRFSAALLPPSYPMTASVGRFPDMAHSNKRPCKASELNRRVTVSDSDCNYAFNSRFRVSALTRYRPWGSSGQYLEQTVDDQSQSTLKSSTENGRSRGNKKSPEELHFEAIEDYWLQYENGDGDGEEANTALLEGLFHKASSDEEAGSHTSNENICQDTSEGLPCVDDPANSQPRSFGSIDNIPSQIGVSSEMEERNLSRKLSSSSQTKTVGTIDEPKKPSPADANAHLTVTFLERDSDLKLVSQTDDGLYRSKSEEKESMQSENYQSEDIELESKVQSKISDDICGLSDEQKIRMELHKAAALARRNLRCCEDAVAEAQAKRLPFPKFESLLVEKSWATALKSEFQKPYMERLHQFVSQEAAGRIPIYPPPSKLFNAFNSCPLDKVKVVILGQDPYHGSGQAMGLCFSVEKGIKLPSSLTNIFLEIQNDVNCDFPTHGNLEKWAYQGVLLLNTVLTVRDRHPNSHAKKGWEFFTDAAIRTLVQQRNSVVFLLWGNQAQEKLRLINKTSHHILKAYHPSGISAHRGFFKCRHFSKTNQLLMGEGLLPIDWQL